MVRVNGEREKIRGREGKKEGGEGEVKRERENRESEK